MVKVLNWKDKFGISEPQWLEWSREVAPGEDILAWALRENKLPQDVFLRWAMEELEMPRLQLDFFSAPPSIELQKEAQNAGPWSAQLVPVGRWQEFWIAACVLPPEALPANTICVLAPAQALKDYWEKWQNSSSPEMPDGLVTASVNIDFSTLTRPPAQATAQTANSPLPPKPPSEPVLHATPPPLPTEPLPQPAFVPKEKPPATVVPPAITEPPPTLVNQDATSLDVGTRSGLVPPPPPAEDPKIEEHEPTVTKSINFMELRTRAEPPPPETPPPSDTRFEKCGTFEEVAQLAFSKMAELFEQQMILVFQNNQLVPWKWSANFRAPPQIPALNVNVRNLFRVVYVSCLPYHGPVTPNPVNDQFFADWRQGQRPAHITVVPLMINTEMAGMLLGISEKPPIDHDHMRSLLAQTEDIARGVSLAFHRLHKTTAQAA